MATAVVAVATGDGIRRIFYSLGVKGMVTGGRTMNPSTAQLLEAVQGGALRRGRDPAEQQEHHPRRRAGRRPHQEGRLRGAHAASPKASPRCWPTTPKRPVPTAKAMISAAENVVAGEVTQAVRDSSCDLGPIKEGDFLGIA